MRRIWLVLLWVCVGNAAAGGLYWWLLNVPESSVWAVGLSAVLVLAILETATVTLAGAALLWPSDARIWPALKRALGCLPAFLLALALCAVIWWLTERAASWFVGHAGEIDATFMSRFGWTRTAWLHRAIAIVFDAIQLIVAPIMALSLLIFAAHGGSGELARRRWLRAVFSRRLLGAGTIFEVALILLPLQALYWRPRRLPPTSIEGVFVAVKLGVIFLLVNAGIALMLRAIVTAAGPEPKA